MEWVKKAKVGDKVVCIDASPGAIDPGLGYYLELNKIYTIREITTEFSEPAISVLEHPSTYIDRADGNRYNGYVAARRFRPIEPRKTDISVFTDMLKKVDQPISIGA